MKICYLLESTYLSGGVRVVFDQARALAKKGHQVRIRSLKGDHSWYPYHVYVEYVVSLDIPFDISDQPDAIICTYWTTVKYGLNLKIEPIFHFCQGYEGNFPELESYKRQIDQTYNQNIPKITIGEWVSKQLIYNFGQDKFPIHCIGQIVDTSLFRPKWPSRSFKIFLKKKRSPQILMVGDCFIFSKGIEDGLQAISLLRKRGYSMSLTRVATIRDTYNEECNITQVDKYYLRIDPKQMALLYRQSDILLAPTRAEEGFGLPFAEALASGLPAVATKIPSYLSFDQKKDYACFVDINDVQGMAEAVSLVLNNHRLSNKLKKRGPKLVQKRFSAETVASRLEQVIKNYKTH